MVIRDQLKVNEATLTYLNGILPSEPIFGFESEIEEYSVLTTSCRSLDTFVPHLRAQIPSGFDIQASNPPTLPRALLT
jgi:hypothetical protein